MGADDAQNEWLEDFQNSSLDKVNSTALPTV